jgi:hypothetical protein
MRVVAIYGRRPCSTGPEYVGTVLDRTDYRAWSNTLAFPRSLSVEDLPAIEAHVQRFDALITTVPVLWDFGSVYWENPASLRAPQPEDLLPL